MFCIMISFVSFVRLSVVFCDCSSLDLQTLHTGVFLCTNSANLELLYTHMLWYKNLFVT